MGNGTLQTNSEVIARIMAEYFTSLTSTAGQTPAFRRHMLSVEPMVKITVVPFPSALSSTHDTCPGYDKIHYIVLQYLTD